MHLHVYLYSDKPRTGPCQYPRKYTINA